MSTQQEMEKALEENQEDVQRLIELGLPGCLAIGYVPGSRPGLLRPADQHHKALVRELLKHLPRPTIH